METVETKTSKTMTIGGSFDAVLSLGADYILDIDTKESSLDVFQASKSVASKGKNFKIDVGASVTEVEAHARYNVTDTLSDTDIKEYIGEKINNNKILKNICVELNNMENNLKDFLIDKTLEGYGLY